MKRLLLGILMVGLAATASAQTETTIYSRDNQLDLNRASLSAL